MTPPLLLLTRPRPQSERFAQLCRSECPPHRTLIAPMTTIMPLPFDPVVFEDAAAVILTSPNAVPAVRGRGLPVWCVGPGTAEAARAAGLKVAHQSGGDAEHLLADLRAAGPRMRLVHAHGRHLARDLVAALTPEGFDIASAVVYEARTIAWDTPVLPAIEAAAHLVAPLFSPRAAGEFAARLDGRVPEGLRIVAISANCAARLPKVLRARSTIARTPDAAAMCRAIAARLPHLPSEP
ncbi:MAG TPA: uroporphyrinogen-III synthase [Paracoccus sp.]|nr:uroporphyrinogen-III synthase [Paracoccus sp. (in: a-proteobacteria)]